MRYVYPTETATSRHRRKLVHRRCPKTLQSASHPDPKAIAVQILSAAKFLSLGLAGRLMPGKGLCLARPQGRLAGGFYKARKYGADPRVHNALPHGGPIGAPWQSGLRRPHTPSRARGQCIGDRVRPADGTEMLASAARRS